jgi:site-specific recombinase XerD
MFADFNNQARAVQDVINDFISSKNGKQAVATVQFYKERLGEFSKYLEKEGIIYVHEIKRAVIDRYMDSKREKNPDISNQSLNCNLRAIRALVNYCIEEEYMKYFITSRYKDSRYAAIRHYTERQNA